MSDSLHENLILQVSQSVKTALSHTLQNLPCSADFEPLYLISYRVFLPYCFAMFGGQLLGHSLISSSYS